MKLPWKEDHLGRVAQWRKRSGHLIILQDWSDHVLRSGWRLRYRLYTSGGATNFEDMLEVWAYLFAHDLQPDEVTDGNAITEDRTASRCG